MLTATQTDLMQLTQTTRLPKASVWAVKVAFISLLWTQRFTTRRALRDMPLTRLDDIGISLNEARAEARKWFWKA